MLGRFPSDPSILATFIQHALTAAATATPTAAAPTTADGATAAAASYGQELEQLVLHVLKDHQGPCDAAKADQRLAGRLHMLLYNHGVAKFEAKSFETAVEFFAASLDFAEVRGWCFLSAKGSQVCDTHVTRYVCSVVLCLLCVTVCPAVQRQVIQ